MKHPTLSTRTRRVDPSAFAPGVIDRAPDPRKPLWRRVLTGVWNTVAMVCVCIVLALLAQAGGIWQQAEARQAALCERVGPAP